MIAEFSWYWLYCQWQGRQCQRPPQKYNLMQVSSDEIMIGMCSDFILFLEVWKQIGNTVKQTVTFGHLGIERNENPDKPHIFGK